MNTTEFFIDESTLMIKRKADISAKKSFIKKRKTFFLMFAIIPAVIMFISISVSLSSASQAPVGEVAAIRGKAEAVGADKVKRQLSLKAYIFADDTLVTGNQSRLQVMFSDNTIISMGPDSEMAIEKYSLKTNENEGEMKTKIREGAFHIMGGAIAKESPDNFVTETPVATIGIRGSMFALNMRESRLSVVFLGGRGIDVFNSSGSVALTDPGFGTVVADRTEMPEYPRKFSGDELQDILQMTVHGEKEDAGTRTEKASDGKQDVSYSGKNTGTAPPGPRPPVPFQPGVRQSDLKPLSPGTAPPVNLSFLPNDAVKDMVNINLDSRLNSFIQTDQRFEARGRQQSVWESTLTETAEKHTGIMNAFIYSDHMEGIVTDQEGTRSFVNFPVPPGDPSAPYEGYRIIENLPVVRDIAGIEEKPGNVTAVASSTGTFALFRIDDYGFIRDDNEYLYTEIGFAGLKALQERRFNEGISVYNGYAAGFASYSDDRIQSSDGGTSDGLKLMINWHNNRFFGFVSDIRAIDTDNTVSESKKSGISAISEITDSGSTPVIMFGKLDAGIPVVKEGIAFGYYNPVHQAENIVENLTVNTSDAEQLQLPEPSPIVWLQGGIEGELYGSRYDGFGLIAEGDSVKIAGDQSAPSGNFSITAGGFRNIGIQDSASGQGAMKGFAIGISEDMNAPDRDSRFFMNSDPDDFVIEIDRDAGNVKGSVSASDIKNSGAKLSGLRIGGSETSGVISAYVDDTHFAAMLSGQGSVISPDGSVAGLKPYGNYLVTNPGGSRLAEYTSWGYWEISYAEQTVESEKNYHLHLPGDMWIAGELTPETKMNELRSTGFKGLYEGKALGVWYNDIGGYRQTSPSINGSSRIEVDFSPSAAHQIKGEIGFDTRDIMLRFQSERISGAAFRAEIINEQSGMVQSGMVNGAFFGPGADSAAGSFAAKLENGTLTGVFGADIKKPVQ